MAREYLRLLALTIFVKLDERLKQRTLVNRVLDRDEQRRLEELRGRYQDIYIALAVLEERIAGNLPAVEGLLLVRERAKPY